jgi:hypothetical protein
MGYEVVTGHEGNIRSGNGGRPVTSTDAVENRSRVGDSDELKKRVQTMLHMVQRTGTRLRGQSGSATK